MTTRVTNRTKVENAIRHQLKIRFQVADTPEFEFTLFHPYISFLDAMDGPSVIGVVERHDNNPSVNYLTRQKLGTITFVEILPVNFEPDREIWDSLELDDLDIYVSIDLH